MLKGRTLQAFHEYLDKGLALPWTQEELDLIKSAGITDHLIEWYWTMKQLTGKFHGALLSSTLSHDRMVTNIQQTDGMAMMILGLT